jgi:hypothetical protein
MSDTRKFPVGWTLRFALLLSLLLLAGPASVHGQMRGTLEIHGGRASSRQLWSGSFATEQVEGISFGVAVDVQTPVPFLSVRPGLAYTRRGSVVWDSERDPDRGSEAHVSSHYLAVPIHGKLALRLGPVAAYVFGGPMLDLLLTTGCTREFCHLLREERLMVLNVSAGLGVGLDLSERFRTGLELRVAEGLTEAYAGDSGGVRNRSLELLVLVGFPI